MARRNTDVTAAVLVRNRRMEASIGHCIETALRQEHQGTVDVDDRALPAFVRRRALNHEPQWSSMD
jgi:hypothetical protein